MIDEEKSKDLKVYDLCLRAFSAPNLKNAFLWCLIILKQLDDILLKRIKEIHPEFNKNAYEKHFKNLVFDIEFMRFINLRNMVLNTDEGYQYFDTIISDDETDVYNFNEELEKRITEEEFYITEFLGKVMSALIIEERIEEILESV